MWLGYVLTATNNKQRTRDNNGCGLLVAYKLQWGGKGRPQVYVSHPGLPFFFRAVPSGRAIYFDEVVPGDINKIVETLPKV